MAAGGRWDRRGVPPPNDPYQAWTAPAPGGTRWSPYMAEMYRIETHARLCPHTGVLAIPSSRTALTGGGQKQSPGQPDFAKRGHWSIRRSRSFSIVPGDPHPVWELRSHTMALGNASLFRHPNCYVGGQSLFEQGLASCMYSSCHMNLTAAAAEPSISIQEPPHTAILSPPPTSQRLALPGLLVRAPPLASSLSCGTPVDENQALPGAQQS